MVVVSNCLRIAKLKLTISSVWIAENKFHSNTRYLTAYAVVKASGTIEYVLKQMIFDRLSKGTSEETNNFLSKKYS